MIIISKLQLGLKELISCMLKSKSLPFYLLVFSVLTALVLPVLMADGMFMDGVQYACVSKNLANGFGSFWFPYLSQTWWKADLQFFMEHPPLVYGLQSLFFSVFGDSMYTERIYSFLTCVVSAWLIINIWKLLFKEDEQKHMGWLPVLLWIIMPLCFWSYRNNMQENTMGIFTLSSIFCLLIAFHGKQKVFFYLTLSGIFVFLATFSKGLPGAFPLSAIMIYVIIFRNISFLRAITCTLYMVFIPTLIYFLLFQYPPASDSLTFYFFERLVGRVGNEALVSNHFFILSKLGMELLVPASACFVFIFVCKLLGIRPVIQHRERGLFVFFFLLGCAGSVPLMLTTVQRGFYLVPSFPFFAIAFALLILPFVNILFGRRHAGGRIFRLMKSFSIILLLLVFTFSFFRIGKTGRDTELVSDARGIAEILPPDIIAGCTENVYNTWNFQFYLLRYGDISIAPDKLASHPYFIIEKNSSEAVPTPYTNLVFEGNEYYVFERAVTRHMAYH